MENHVFFLVLLATFMHAVWNGMVKNHPDKANDMIQDHNGINLVIDLGVFLKLYKLVITIISLAYFFGIVWFIFCDMHYEIAT